MLAVIVTLLLAGGAGALVARHAGAEAPIGAAATVINVGLPALIAARARSRAVTAGGELAVDEVLDAAVDAVVVAGLLALREARTAARSDPSAAAELCLSVPPGTYGVPGFRRPRPTRVRGARFCRPRLSERPPYPVTMTPAGQVELIMNRSMIAISTAALAAVLVPVAAAPAATSAPTAVRAYVDTRVRDCAGSGSGCRPGAVVHHWHRRGSDSRGVGWVYASREGVRSGTARWLFKKTGGTWKTGGGWKRANRVGSFVEASWGKDGHTGPKYPRGTQVCTQFKGLSAKACVTLK